VAKIPFCYARGSCPHGTLRLRLPYKAPDGTLADERIELRKGAILFICYDAKGTRSEGQTGRLFMDGKEVIGKRNQVLRFGSIELKCYPSRAKEPWAIKGWNYADPGRIRHSWE